MCKVLMFTNGSKVSNLKNYVNVIKKHITKQDDDGFGWCASGVAGVFGERMTEMHHTYRLDVNEASCNVAMIKPTYNSFGAKSDVAGPMLFHGRTSTNDRTLRNTHPIIKNGWTLIHNGVVNNRGPDYKQITTNDTEHLVQYMSTTGISGVEKFVSGYYAFGAIDQDGRLHVARDGVARLVMAWSRTIESFIFATTIELLKGVAKELKLKIGPIDLVEDNIYAIYERNKEVECRYITPRGYDYKEYGYARKSLHYLGDDELNETKPWSKIEVGGKAVNIIDATKSDEFRLKDETEVDRLIQASEDRNQIQTVEDILDSNEAGMFFDEAYLIDGSFTITNETGDVITIQQFDQLTQMEQLMCEIYRPDGTVLSYESIMHEAESHTSSSGAV